MPGIFTDEPNLNVPQRGSMRWTPDLFEQFSKKWGYDLRPSLPSLFEDVGDYRKVRYHYYSLLLDLFIERWSKPWYEYTSKTGIFWTGHYWEHGWPSPADGPDNMAMYAWHQVPAIDMLFNQFSDDVNAQFGNVRAVKELSSVASQTGRRRMLSETYGGGGWELRFEDMKRLGEWEYVLGVNLMNQHLSFQTIAGARKHDYPQSFSYHEPWWKFYHVMGNYFARLSLAMSTGEQVNRTLVLEPTTSVWMYASRGQTDPRLKPLGNAFQALLNKFETQQVEYDLGSENILKDRAKAAAGKVTVGKRAYDVVVIGPSTENLDGATVTLLENYLAGGGKVLSFVDPPARVNGAETDRMARLAAQYAAQWTRAAAPEEPAAAKLLASSDFELKWNVDAGGKLFHMRRQLNDGQLLYVVNSSLEKGAAGSVKIKGGAVTEFDLASGLTKPHPAVRTGDGVEIAFDLAPGGSVLWTVSKSGAPVAAPKVVTASVPVKAAAPIAVRRRAPNTLTIDYCDLTLDGKTEKDVYFNVASDKTFKHFGFEANPWDAAVQYKTNIVDRDKFPAGSKVAATYYFDLADVSLRTGLRAVVERPAIWKVAVNGKPVKPVPGASWLDREFAVYDIAAYVVAGRNAVQVTADPMSVHAEIEPIYITGDFSVEPQASGWKLTAAKKTVVGAWKEQGLPFYSNEVTYSGTYHFDKVPAKVKVQLGKWGGSVAEVRVNGKSAGVVAWQPYEVNVTPLLQAGANRIEVVVYGTLKNLLGPHHPPINRGLTGPNSFRKAPVNTPPGAEYDQEPYGLFDEFQVLRTER